MIFMDSALGDVELTEKNHVLECDVKGTAFTGDEYEGTVDTRMTVKEGTKVDVYSNCNGYVVFCKVKVPGFDKGLAHFMSDDIVA